ncbi:uncharacterized protein [Gossypium hirsutum]|uniref:Uncharacterized protein n=1 Tax=Gossypium hirsutum TaxID=3635 RepID=A0ABM3A935_GOSHI|nr:uncharacterized protein LOC121218327 [Gossypium hirsutum]
MGIVKFDDTSSVENPLPNHGDKGINAVTESSGKEIKTNVVEVNTPMKEVWKKMVERGLIAQNSKKCSEFRALLQGLMDNKELEFFKYVGSPEEADVCASEERSMKDVYKVNHPVVIISRPRMNEAGAQVAPMLVIQKPVTFPYKDSKRVPWNYSCNVTIPGEEIPINASKEGQDEGFYTRSGRRYTPNTKVKQVKGKSLAIEQKKEKSVGPEPAVNESLHKQPARISVLALLLSSETHRDALIKVLNETYVANDISVNKLDRLVNNISADNFIFFNDNEVPPGGRGSTKALHITTRLRAFDGTERKVMGRIEVPLLIRPSTYEVDFLVMDIKPSYNYLLGRPWIHSAGAVPSSLHQKLKLVTEGRLVTINADAPYLEANDEAIECSFRSLEFVNATFITEGNKIPMPRLSETTRMGLRLTIGKGALPGRRHGRYLQGRINVPMIKDKQNRFGLGFKLEMKQRKKELEKKQERRARLSRGEIK